MREVEPAEASETTSSGGPELGILCGDRPGSGANSSSPPTGDVHDGQRDAGFFGSRLWLVCWVLAFLRQCPAVCGPCTSEAHVGGATLTSHSI